MKTKFKHHPRCATARHDTICKCPCHGRQHGGPSLIAERVKEIITEGIRKEVRRQLRWK